MKITIEVEFTGWDEYEGVSPELLLEDSGIYDGLKDGVSIQIIKNQPNENR